MPVLINVVRKHRFLHRPLCSDTQGFEASTAVGIGRHPIFTRDSMLSALSDLFARRIGQQDPFVFFLCSRPTSPTRRKETADW